MKQESQKLRWLPIVTAVVIGAFGANTPALGECLSPSAVAGDTATTVYRCPEEDSAGGQSPVIIDPETTTEVKRGSAELPWFEPKPTKTEDPIETSKVPLEKKPVEKAQDAAETPPPPVDLAKPKVIDTEAPATETAKIKAAKPKPAMAKPAKAKLAKVKRAKSKLAKKKQLTKTAKASAPQQPVKTEPAKSDDKVIVMTKKDMSIGSRIVNWLGF